MGMENWWNDTTGKNWGTWRRKTCLRPLHPPKISHEMTWDWTEASRLRGQQLTAWAMTLLWRVGVGKLRSALFEIPHHVKSQKSTDLLHHGKNLKSCSGALLPHMVIVGRLCPWYDHYYDNNRMLLLPR
jgi:hypothetical protein